MPVWTRGAEAAEILAPFPQKLAVTAFGNSASTPAQGVVGEIVAFDSVADLMAAPDSAVRGKIVFVSHAMPRTQDGSGYGFFGGPRRQGPSIASRKGAIAIVVRSIGTDYHRNPHTGVQSFAEGVRPIPAGALAVRNAGPPPAGTGTSRSSGRATSRSPPRSRSAGWSRTTRALTCPVFHFPSTL